MSLSRPAFPHFVPDRNPAVLDTATWDPEVVVAALRGIPAADWGSVLSTTASEELRRGPVRLVPLPDFASPVVLACLDDGQRAFVAAPDAPVGPADAGAPLCRRATGSHTLSAWPASAAVTAVLLAAAAPVGAGPRALGCVPRLGIGTRMSTHVWPGVWQAMQGRAFAANAIQNSVRELNLLTDLQSGRPPRTNHLFGFGAMQEGHTGSTFEGLWLAGVLSALEHGSRGDYGADADHIMVKRAADGLERAVDVVRSARHYTFFTLDVSDVLDYDALTRLPVAEAEARFRVQAGAAAQSDVLLFHRDAGDGLPSLPRDTVVRCAAKHTRALDATVSLRAEIARVRARRPFDLELSIDETPAAVAAADAVSSVDEVVFLLREFRRRGLTVTHLAPNLGVEKGTDYRLPDGLPGLSRRVRDFERMLGDRGIMLDCHSGDDLGRDTRRAIGQAAKGRIHFKISPSLQTLFGEALHATAPDSFRFWWEDTLEYARREAAAGSPIAAQDLRTVDPATPDPHHPLFHHFCFATVGRRDDAGTFLFRESFYSLPAEVTEVYTQRVVRSLEETADDLFGDS